LHEMLIACNTIDAFELIKEKDLVEESKPEQENITFRDIQLRLLF